MRFARLIAVAAAASLGAATVASAQWTYPHTFRVTAGSPVHFNNHVAGPAKGKIDGGAEVSIFCTDFYNASSGALVNAYVTDAGGNDFSKTRFGTLAGARARYQQAAYLTTLFASANQNRWGYIQYAIWQLFNSPGPNTGPSFPAAQAHIDTYLAIAATNYRNYYYTNFRIITHDAVINRCQGVIGVRSCGNQEFIEGDLTAVPEPATMGLLALGLVGLGVASARRRRKAS